MLPATLRFWLFDTLSVKTMRFVSAVPTRQAEGLTKQVYEMIKEDFFKNGSLTSRSKVPELMAAIWTGGREAMLVEDKVDRTTKDAISAVLSQINDCPYCEDMLVSLVHAGGEHEAAGDIFEQTLDVFRQVHLSNATKGVCKFLQWLIVQVRGDLLSLGLLDVLHLGAPVLELLVLLLHFGEQSDPRESG